MGARADRALTRQGLLPARLLEVSRLPPSSVLFGDPRDCCATSKGGEEGVRAQGHLPVGYYQQHSAGVAGGGQGQVPGLLMQAREPGVRNRAEQKSLSGDEGDTEKNGRRVEA